MYSTPYVIVFFILSVLSIPVTNSHKNRLYFDAVKFMILSYFILAVIGTRAYLMTDWIAYKPVFDSLPVIGEDGFFIKFIENEYATCILYTLFGIISKSIYNSYFLFQFFCILFDYIFWIKIIEREDKRYEIFFMFFLFLFTFYGPTLEINLLRNIKAVVLFVWSIKYIRTRNLRKFLLCNFLGILFHTSAILFLPLYFVLHKKINRKLLLAMFFLGSVIFILKINWFIPFLRFSIKILPLPKDFYVIAKILDALWQKGHTTRYGSLFGYFERAITFLLFYFYQVQLFHLSLNFFCIEIIELNLYLLFLIYMNLN